MQSTPSTWTLGHRASLDGIRGVAILLVVISHGTEPWTAVLGPLGSLGVGLFFVLSGFLITSLLLEEKEGRGQIGLVRFYQRRAVRLLPALAVMLTIAYAFDAVTTRELVAVIAYISNWYQAATATPGFLSFTWSLAVEEQFYIVWPLLFLCGLTIGGRRAVVVLASAGGASLCRIAACRIRRDI